MFRNMVKYDGVENTYRPAFLDPGQLKAISIYVKAGYKYLIIWLISLPMAHRNITKGKTRKKKNDEKNDLTARRKRESSFTSFWCGHVGKDSVKLKGNRNGIIEVLWRALKKREAVDDLLVVTINEYKTSMICNNCYTDSLKSLKGVRGHSILDSKSCSILWQHSVRAPKNMMSISISIWKANFPFLLTLF
ncbi:MAG: hypothetical protein EXX96DRAFT_537659 [Benjaminiella poitrasii]|nr:MAG: hypothetical protein EXX96DRAFT_537659 [Benjaminiella poitrasii]